MRSLLLGCLLTFLAFGCSTKRNSSLELPNSTRLRAVLPDSSETAALDGNSLAHVYCSACHLFPEPTLLPKKIWETNVLPAMGGRLGIGNNIGMYYNIPPQEIANLLQADIFPDKPLIAKKDWIKIQDFYRSRAPDSLPETPLTKTGALKQFRIYPLPLNKGRYPLTTLIRYEPTTRELLIGDRRNKLFRLNSKLETIDSIQVDTPPVAVQPAGQGHYQVISIGSMMPSDSPYGKMHDWQLAGNGKAGSVTLLLSNLRRPVQLATADLNQDKREDVVICHYGNQLGKLSWYEQQANGSYQEHLLKALPGSRQVIIRDLNHDNRPDLLVLFAQATESIVAFYNQGNGQFEEEKLVQLPAVYGSSYFELADFNRDGSPDILLSNGDNADLSVVIKPYHGIRVFLNDKQNAFRETVFLRMPGASKAVARDFDQDGDLDIAAIAFFPDYKRQPEGGFFYFENLGRNKFAAKTFPEATAGRWLTLEAGDVDQDGDEDIILGSFIYAATPAPAALQERWAQNGPSVLVLQNQKQSPLQ